MIQIDDKKKCTGCGACSNKCPQKCIDMVPDDEGFLYPVVNESLCVNCDLCQQVCPVLHVAPEQPVQQYGYIVQNKDNDARRESTSGGAFSAVASYVLKQGGVVCSAAFNQQMEVEHIVIDSESDLPRLRGSKYVQSRISDTLFIHLKSLLEAGRAVCFGGTPCQAEALRRFIGKPYDNLIIIDVVCRAVCSPLILSKYLQMHEIQIGDILRIDFRNKHYGYKYSNMSVKGSKGIFRRGIESDPYLRAFFSGTIIRPSCTACVFRKRYRVSDITLWDCFAPYRFNSSFDDDGGTTRLLVQSENGQKLFENIKDSIRWDKVDADQLIAGSVEMVQSVNRSAISSVFFEDAQHLNGPDLFGKYFPDSVNCRIKRFLRRTMCKIGMYGVVKKCYYYIVK